MVISILLLFSTLLIMGFDSTQKKVYDNAGILTESEESQLQQQCIETAQANKIDIIIATTANTNGKTTLKFAEDFYIANGFGYDKSKGDGILLLIDMQNREMYIATSGNGITYFSDSRIASMNQIITNYLKKGDYNNACKAFVKNVETYMKSLPSSSENANMTLSEKILDHMALKILGSLAVGAVVVLIMMYGAKARMTVGSQTYVKDHRFDVMDTRDIYINTTVVKHKIPINNNNGNGGGSFHVGSGGNRFGGGGSKF